MAWRISFFFFFFFGGLGSLFRGLVLMFIIPPLHMRLEFISLLRHCCV